MTLAALPACVAFIAKRFLPAPCRPMNTSRIGKNGRKTKKLFPASAANGRDDLAYFDR